MSNIAIEQEHSFKTIEAFKSEYKNKGLEPDPDTDFPKDKRKMLERLKKFDAHVDPSKPITKRIISMVRMPVHAREDGKRVTKDSLVFHARLEGSNWADVPSAVEYSAGFYLRPNLVFSVKNNKIPFDPQTGQKVGSYNNQGSIWEHDIFLPEDKKERVKFLNEFLEQYPDTFPEELNLQYRQPNSQNTHYSQRGGNFNWQTFTELSLRELGEIQGKGYYKDDKGTLRDKDGAMVEYDRSTGKVSAIQ